MALKIKIKSDIWIENSEHYSIVIIVFYIVCIFNFVFDLGSTV